MPITYVLTSELREKLKTPIGVLIHGTSNETVKQIKHILDKERPSALVSIGDTVTRNLVKNQILPKLAVVDNLVMRKKAPPTRFLVDKILKVKNPPGSITSEAVCAMKKALEGNKRVTLVVEGEEDLLTLAAILYAPLNALVVYGQPHEGVVVVTATKEKKAEACEILKSMEKARKTK